MPSPDSTKEIDTKQSNCVALRNAFQALKDYNDRHNFGGMLAGMLIKMIDHSEKIPKKPSETELMHEAIAAEAELGELGLKFDFNKQAGVTMFHQGGATKPKELRLEITDATKLTDFLRQLDATDLEEDNHLTHDLKNMIRILSQQMVQYYESCDSRGTTVVDNANALLGEFRRLGLDEAAVTIETYWIHSTRRNLREFMVLSDTQCFHKPGGGGFEPARWHVDSATARYEEMWKQTEQAIQAAMQNPRAISMVMTALDNLIHSAEVAVADMQRIMEEEGEEAHEYTLQHTERIETALQYKRQYEDMKARLAPSASNNSTAN